MGSTVPLVVLEEATQTSALRSWSQRGWFNRLSGPGWAERGSMLVISADQDMPAGPRP